MMLRLWMPIRFAGHAPRIFEFRVWPLGSFGRSAIGPDPTAKGTYKIVRQLPVERDNRLMYRIKSATETFERTAEEHQLRRVD